MGTEIKKELHLSHSQISEFTRCPRKYHLHYRLGLPAEFCPSGLLFGSAVHEAIAFYNQKRLEGKEATLDELSTVFHRCWERESLPVRLKAGESKRSAAARAKEILEFFLLNPPSTASPQAGSRSFSGAIWAEPLPNYHQIGLPWFARPDWWPRHLEHCRVQAELRGSPLE